MLKKLRIIYSIINIQHLKILREGKMELLKKTAALAACSLLIAAASAIAQAGEKSMSKNAYRGSDRAALEKKIAAAYTDRYSTDTVLKVVITQSGWQAVKKVENGVKITNHLISAEVAVDSGDKATVWQLTFRKIGSRVELFSIGESFSVSKAALK